MLVLLSLSEIVESLGVRIKNERLRQGKYSQREFAKKAGIAYSTYQRIEQTGKGSIEDYVKCFIALRRLNDLESLLVEPEYSPILEQNRKAMGVKKRVFSKAKKGVKE